MTVDGDSEDFADDLCDEALDREEGTARLCGLCGWPP
jgi:hypothetical protein